MTKQSLVSPFFSLKITPQIYKKNGADFSPRHINSHDIIALNGLQNTTIFTFCPTANVDFE